MKTIKELKCEACDALNGRWGKYAVLTLVYMLIVTIVSMTSSQCPSGLAFLYQIAVSILLIPLGWAYCIIFLRNLRGADDSSGIPNMFDGYKDFMRITFTQALMGIYIFLWSLLLIVPGIIKSYSYRMTAYVLHDCPDLKYNGAIERSMSMMKGHKMKLFLLDLSFIGWYILVILTAGIGLLWVYPYHCSAIAAFYRSLVEEYNA